MFEDLLAENDIVSLSEKYEGKSKEFAKIETQIGIARDKYLGNKTAKNFYTDKDLDKIGSMLATAFGFKVIDFNLVNDPSPNAMTVPVGMSISANLRSMDDTEFILDSTGHRFKNKSLSAFVRVTTGMWCNSLFTDAEILAIIIHEIGHNFQHTVNNGLRVYSLCMYALQCYYTIANLLSGVGIGTGIVNLVTNDSELRAAVNTSAKQNPFMSGLVKLGSSVVGVFRSIFAEVFGFLNIATFGTVTGLTGLAITIMNDPISTIGSALIAPINRGAENISDNFASELGYGPELISALSKISLEPDASGSTLTALSKKVPIFDSICTVLSLPSMILLSIFNTHPMTPKRAVNVVRDLENELNSPGISPAMKKEIKSQIVDIKQTVDKYTKVTSAVDGQALKKAIFSMMADYNRDPKGPITKIFSTKNITESMEEDVLDSLDYDTTYGEDYYDNTETCDDIINSFSGFENE